MRGKIRSRAGHEWTVATLGSGILAVAMTWPALAHPRTTIPQDVYDPALQAWQVAWGGHALLNDPLGVWNANAAVPEQNTLAFSDSLLGYAPAGWFGSGPADAVLRYNLLFVLAFALATLGMYALVRQVGGGRLAASLAGVAFAYAPWRFAHAGHLNILSTGGIALALAMLARGHGFTFRASDATDADLLPAGRGGDRLISQPAQGRHPDGGPRPACWVPPKPGTWCAAASARPTWALAGWLVAAWQLTLGFGLGVPFGYVLLGIVLVTAIGLVVRREPLPQRLLRADLLGGAIFAGTVVVFMRPYLAVLSAHPDARRSVAYLDLFSPPLRGFFTAWPDSWLWGASARRAAAGLGWPAEMTLLPGFTLMALALAGVFISAWTLRARMLLAGGVVVSVWVAMGTAAPWHGRFGYLILLHLPGFDGSRTPGRLVLWTLLLLCLLAAGLLTCLAEQVSTRGAAHAATGTGHATRSTSHSASSNGHAASSTGHAASSTDHGPWGHVRSRRARFLLLLPLFAVLLEGISHTPHPVVPVSPVAFGGLSAPVLVLPTTELSDLDVMLWSTDGFPAIVNGSSGYNPPRQAELRAELQAFPDVSSVTTLRELGVRSVIVLRNADQNLYARALSVNPATLGLSRLDRRSALIFTLEPLAK